MLSVKLLNNPCKNKQQQLRSSIKYFNQKVLTECLNQKLSIEHGSDREPHKDKKVKQALQRGIKETIFDPSSLLLKKI